MLIGLEVRGQGLGLRAGGIVVKPTWREMSISLEA